MPDGIAEFERDAGAIAGDAGSGNAGDVGAGDNAPRRRRGRPKHVDGGGVEYVNPANLGGDSGAGGDGDGGGAAPARRGRKPGASSRAKAVPLSLETLIVALTAAQITAFKLTDVPECVLSADQNKNLAEAMQRVSRHYPMVISEKAADITALAVVAGNIAFMQFVAYQRRTAKPAH